MAHRLSPLLALLPLLVPVPLSAATCRNGEVAALAADIARHYEAGTLRDLATGVTRLPLTLRIESSLEGTVRRQRLPGLAEVEAAIARDEGGREQPRRRSPLGPLACLGEACRFGPSEGILHNQLYLKEVTILRWEQCLVVTGILLLDGD